MHKPRIAWRARCSFKLIIFCAVLACRSGIVLLKAAEKRLTRTGSIDGMVELLGAKNIHTLLPPPSSMIKGKVIKLMKGRVIKLNQGQGDQVDEGQGGQVESRAR
eukprot:1158409-Pelagomonas_calceolata.AAC.7